MKKKYILFLLAGLLFFSNININAKTDYTVGSIDIPNYQYIITNKRPFNFSIKSKLRDSFRNEELKDVERNILIKIQSKSYNHQEIKKTSSDEVSYNLDATKFKVGETVTMITELKKGDKTLSKDTVQFTIKNPNDYSYIDFGLSSKINWNSARYENLNIDTTGIVYNSKNQKIKEQPLIVPKFSFSNNKSYSITKDKKTKNKYTVSLNGKTVNQDSISVYLNGVNTNVPFKNNFTNIVVRKYDYIDKIESYQTEIIMDRGDQLFLTPEYTPSDSMEIHNVAWNSSDSNIVSVDIQGMITAMNKGTANVTVKSEFCKLTYKIKVIASLKNIKLPENIKLQVGINKKLKYALDPIDADIDELSFKSSDPMIVSINEKGILMPHREGKATITVIHNKMEVSVPITVVPKLNKIITPDTIELYQDTSSVLPISTEPVRFDDLVNAKFESSNKKVATIDKTGTISAIGIGECDITITYGDIKAKTHVIIKPIVYSDVKIVKDTVVISKDYDLRNLLEGEYDSTKISYLYDDRVNIKNHMFVVGKDGEYSVGIKYNDETTYINVVVKREEKKENNSKVDYERLYEFLIEKLVGVLNEVLG